MEKIEQKESEASESKESKQNKPKNNKRGAKKTQRKRKAKDPDAPKRSLGAYFFYFKENNANIREMYPDCNQKEIVSKIAGNWKSLTEEQKQPYLQLSNADKLRYTQEKKIYEGKLKEEQKESIE